MIEKRRVSYERGKALADEFGWLFFETSAKENINVTEAFMAAARMAVSGGCTRAQMHMHATQLRLTLADMYPIFQAEEEAEPRAKAAAVRPC